MFSGGDGYTFLSPEVPERWLVEEQEHGSRALKGMTRPRRTPLTPENTTLDDHPRHLRRRHPCRLKPKVLT